MMKALTNVLFQFLDPLTPSPQSQSSANRLRSGRLMVLDTESILIPSLDLQMRNPGYFFWTGNTTYPDGLSGQESNSDLSKNDQGLTEE